MTLEEIARDLAIKVHEPFAEFLHASLEETNFKISLLDCYRFAGHACHAITGAFLCTRAAIKELFPDTNVCERGDVAVEFGSEIHERASGPRSNVIGYITGAWGETGFGGWKGRFSRRNLVSYGHKSLAPNAVLFRRISTGKTVVVEYQPQAVIAQAQQQALPFPDSWRQEVRAVLDEPDRVLRCQVPNSGHGVSESV
jgi:hypothetical protein